MRLFPISSLCLTVRKTRQIKNHKCSFMATKRAPAPSLGRRHRPRSLRLCKANRCCGTNGNAGHETHYPEQAGYAAASRCGRAFVVHNCS